MTASDFCGPVGPTLTRPLITISPGGLSSVVPRHLPEGHTFEVRPGKAHTDAEGRVRVFPFNKDYPAQPVNLADLACPTYGVGTKELPDGSIATTVGYPYLPLLVPPKAITRLDPVWNTDCKRRFMMKSQGVLDPPRVLPIVSDMVASSDIADSQGHGNGDLTYDPESTLVKPGQTATVDQPYQTGFIVGPPSCRDCPIGPEFHEHAPEGSLVPPNSPKQKGKDEQSSKLKHDGKYHGMLLPSSWKVNQDSNAPDAGQVNHDSDNNDDRKPGEKTSPQNDNPPSSSNLPSSTNPLEAAKAVHDGDHIFTPAATGFKVGKVHITPGGPAATIAGTAVSLGPSRHLIIGEKTTQLPPASAPLNHDGGNRGGGGVEGDADGSGGAGGDADLDNDNDNGNRREEVGNSGSAVEAGGRHSHKPLPAAAAPIFTVAGHTFTANPTGFKVAGSSVIPGGPAATLSGTKISLHGSGELIVGKQAFSLQPPPAPAFEPASPIPAEGSIQTVGGHKFTPQATGFVVAGTPVRPGKPAITVAGTSMSLGPAGEILMLGDSTVYLKPTPAPDPIAAVDPAYYPAAITLGKQTVKPNPNGFAVAGGTRVAPGGPAITIGGTRVFLNPSGTLLLEAGHQTMTVPLNSPFLRSPALAHAPALAHDHATGSGSRQGGQGHRQEKGSGHGRAAFAFNLNGKTITPNPTGFTIPIATDVGSKKGKVKTVSPGGPAVTVSGTGVSLGPSGKLIVGDATVSLPSTPSHTSTNGKGGETDQRHGHGKGQGRGAGAGAEATGEGSGDGNTNDNNNTNVITIGTHTITANPTGFVADDGSTVKPGGSKVIIDGTTLSLDKSGILDFDRTSRSSLVSLTPTTSTTATATVNTTAMTTDGASSSGDGGGGGGGGGGPITGDAMTKTKISLSLSLFLSAISACFILFTELSVFSFIL